ARAGRGRRERAERRAGRRGIPVGPIALGVGAAALVAGAGVGGLLVVENDAATGMCTAGVCRGAARAQAEHVEGLAIATDVLLIGGGLVALTGLVLTLVLREASPDAPPVSAACAETGCALALQGVF